MAYQVLQNFSINVEVICRMDFQLKSFCQNMTGIHPAMEEGWLDRRQETRTVRDLRPEIRPHWVDFVEVSYRDSKLNDLRHFASKRFVKHGNRESKGK